MRAAVRSGGKCLRIAIEGQGSRFCSGSTLTAPSTLMTGQVRDWMGLFMWECMYY